MLQAALEDHQEHLNHGWRPLPLGDHLNHQSDLTDPEVTEATLRFTCSGQDLRA